MKKAILSVAISIGIAFLDFAQEGATLNTNQNLFAVNERGTILSQANESLKSNEEITIFVDTTKTTTFEFHSTLSPSDTLFETFPDGYIDTIVFIGCRNIKALEVSIHYYGEDKLGIQIQDSRLVAVQQALDSSGNWVSLEHYFHSDCGSSYSYDRIRKDQIYLFKIGKYEGNYPTKLRLKALINEQIIYSNEFSGSINYEQLHSIYNKKENDDYLFK